MKHLGLAIAISVVTLFCVSCFLAGGGPRDENGPGHYETAWVDPELIVSDSLITLIRSDRVDRVFVSEREKHLGESQPTVEFVIEQDFCTVEVNLVGSGGAVVEPLFDGTLRPGNYKLTVDPTRISREIKRQNLQVMADFCGKKKTYELGR